MPLNYLIGIGGTGAKCIESFIYLAAAGLTPENVNIEMIDEDQFNGNLHRTHGAGKRYVQLRNLLAVPRLGFLRKEISVPDQAIMPIKETDENMNVLFRQAEMMHAGVNDGIRGQLFSCLFSESEASVNLSVGFHARPSIGSAILALSQRKNKAAWQGLGSMARNGEKGSAGSATKVFIVGSVFGGTGAAGIPTVARYLRDNSDNSASILELGAALMLPYFRVEGEGNEGPMSEQDVSLALQHYSNLISASQEGVERSFFDALYAIGLDPVVEIPREIEGGGVGQQNPSLLPELLAAVAASHFFQGPSKSGGTKIVRVSGRALQTEINWSDIPRINAGAGFSHDVGKGLSQLIRFAYAYHFVFAECLLADSQSVLRHQVWYANYFGFSGGHEEEVSRVAKELRDFCECVLKWTGSITQYMPRGLTQHLFSLDEVMMPSSRKATGAGHGRAEKPPENDSMSFRLSPTERKDVEAIKRGFANLCRTPRRMSLATVVAAMSEPRDGAERNRMGMAPFVDALFKSCNEDNDRTQQAVPDQQ